MLIKAVSGSDAFFKNAYAVCKCLFLFSQFRTIKVLILLEQCIYIQIETTVLTQNTCCFIHMSRCVVVCFKNAAIYHFRQNYIVTE